MEQMRSFGYICSNCGKAQVHQRSRFALSAAAARMECECEKAALTVETDGVKFRLSVPCGLCGETHQAELDAQQLLEGRGVGLGCPKTRQICCYIGEEQQVMSSVEEMTIRKEKDKAENPEAFTDNVIMYEVLSELKDIAARDGIACSCGSHGYAMQVGRAYVDLVCGMCGGRLRINAATDEDLDRLCCQMKLEIHGR